MHKFFRKPTLWLGIFLSSWAAANCFEKKPTVEIKDWTLEEKIGQFLIVGYRNPEQIERIKPGGVILFSWSMKNIDDTHELLDKLKLLEKKSLKAPLLLGTDHEGGKVLRLRKGLTYFPDALAIGQSKDEDLSFAVGRQMGIELASLGFNLNLAPVLDLGSAGSFLENRVWSEKPEEVSQYTRAYIRGLQSSRIFSVAKHFPGHGSSTIDSHFDLPILTKPFSEIWTQDLAPFRSAIEEGVLGIMTAHVEVPEVARMPASISKEFVYDLLRKKLDFQGLVLSDDVEMGGLSKKYQYPSEELAYRALISGTDMVMVVWSLDAQDKIVQRVKSALTSHEIDMAWVDQKVEHILGAKACLDNEESNPFWKENLKRVESLKLAKKISAQSPVWLRGDSDLIAKSVANRWTSPWSVVLPKGKLDQLWKMFRPQDTTLTYEKRIDADGEKSIVEGMQSKVKSGSPVLVLTMPIASMNEDLFRILKKGLAEDPLLEPKGDSFLLWLHQGSAPSDISESPKARNAGFVSLNNSSFEGAYSFLRRLRGKGNPEKAAEKTKQRAAEKPPEKAGLKENLKVTSDLNH